jgi:hypothetical protein
VAFQQVTPNITQPGPIPTFIGHAELDRATLRYFIENKDPGFQRFLAALPSRVDPGKYVSDEIFKLTEFCVSSSDNFVDFWLTMLAELLLQVMPASTD